MTAEQIKKEFEFILPAGLQDFELRDEILSKESGMNDDEEKQLNRTEIIFALAAHVRSTSAIPYHEMTKWKTEQLRALLKFYESSDEDRGEELIGVFLWPFGYKAR